MRRRTYLYSIGGLTVPTSGCIGLDGTDNSNQNAENRSGSTDVRVDVFSYQPGIIERSMPDALTVSSENDTSYIFFRVQGSIPDPGSFTLHFDGQRYSPVDPDSTFDVIPGGGNTELEPYTRDTLNGWLLFAISSSGDASQTRLTWPNGGEWEPNQDLRRRMGSSFPDLSVDISAPSTFDGSTPLTVSITYSNDDDVPGRFVTAINRTISEVPDVYLPTESEIVPPQSTWTWEMTDDNLPIDRLSELAESNRDVEITYGIRSIPRADTLNIPVEIN